MNYIVGLTGGIGSGKSTIANLFTLLKKPPMIVDADLISRQLVQPGTYALNAIIKHYGKKILHADGSLNRMSLRAHIFRDNKEVIWINNLLHPLIQQQTKEQLYAINSTSYVVWVAPLFIENHLYNRVHRLLVVDVAPEVQVIRAIARDSCSYQHIEKILNQQVSRTDRLVRATDVIDNSGSIERISYHVAMLHNHYLKLASEQKRLTSCAS